MGQIIVTVAGTVADIIANYQAILTKLQALKLAFPNAKVEVLATFDQATITDFQTIQTGSIVGTAIVISARYLQTA